MQKTILRYSQLTCVALAMMAVGHVHDVQAGAYGVVNGVGKGWTSADIRSVTLKTNKVITPADISIPSASISPATGYTYTTNSPSGASTNTYARSKATSLGGWQNRLYAATGDGVDGSPEFEARLNVTPATCAELTVDTVINQQVITETSISGSIEVNTKGSAGTALWLRGFEYTGDSSLIPADDLNTAVNETIEYLKVHGTWKFETLIVGPFEFGSNGCPLILPFTLNTTNIQNLVISLDTMAKSTPFVITCPSDVTFKCGEAVKFPAADVTGGCGQVTGTWSPEENYAFPVGTTPVTVTVTDENGDSTSCSFNVTITDDVKPVSPALPNVTGQCSVTPPLPIALDACSGSITGKTTTVFPITTQGATVVTWTFDDGHGNVTTTNQNVIVDDTIAPATPTLADVIFTTCSGTPATPTSPTTTDNCVGTVTGTTTTTFPITTPGTNLVTWTFNDGNGNQTAATQRVILTGLTFGGFYAPINGTGGSCSNAVIVKSSSSSLPIKFDIKCGTTAITTGTAPVVHIQPYTNCAAGAEVVVTNAVYQNDWHYNWNVSSRDSGTYKITIVLPDGTSQFVFVRLK